MVVAPCTKALPIIDLRQSAYDQEPPTETPLLCEGLLIVSAHYKPPKHQKAQISQPKPAEFNNEQHAPSDWQLGASISESYSRYSDQFLQMHT